MKNSRSRVRIVASALVVLAGAAALPGLVRADTVSLGGIEYKDVKITKIENGELFYESPNGLLHKPIAANLVVSVDNDAALTDAEKLWTGGKFTEAVDGYAKVMDSASKPWERQWAARRLLVCAEKANRFDIAVNAWVALVKDNAISADLKTPTPPDAKSTYIATAISKLKSAAGSADNDSQKTAYLNFLLKLQTTAGDQAGASETAKQLQGVAAGGTSAGPGNNLAVSQQARTNLNLAALALDKKDYKSALDQIQKNRQLFTDVNTQPDALWIIAEAHNGMVADSKNASELQDAALDYMRLVAHFPDSPHAAAALLRAAALEERIGDPDDKKQAADLYQQVATQYKDKPEGQQAKQALDRLNGAH